MYFPSLSILTTLACAALSVAAPLPDESSTAASLEALKDKIGHVPRDGVIAPTAPSTPKVSLTSIFNDVLIKLDPIVGEIKDALVADVTVEVKTAKVVAATEKIGPLLQGTLIQVEVIAADPQGYVLELETVGPVVGTVIQNVVLGLDTGVKGVGTAQGTLNAVVTDVGHLLNENVQLVVTKIVPAAREAIVAKASEVLIQIYYLSIGSVAQTLGLKPPVPS